MAGDPALGGRVRGAMGHRLREGASPGARDGGPCDWSAPCAYDLLFNSQGKVTARLEIPKPWALSIQGVGGDLVVALKLFGAAGDWAGEVADALVRAFRVGITDGRRRRSLDVVGRHIEGMQGVAPPPAERPVMLEFRSPLMLRQGNEMHADPASLLKSIGNRVAGLARWHGRVLAIDPAGLSAAVEHMATGAVWEEARVGAVWKSHSKRQNRMKPMRGVTGTLLLPPPGDVLAALLALAETAQAGSHTTHGLGWYRLVPLP